MEFRIRKWYNDIGMINAQKPIKDKRLLHARIILSFQSLIKMSASLRLLIS
jgi:hypothetical protein